MPAAKVSLEGIIPVCTGSTLCLRSACPGVGDHPRMHGEHGIENPVREREAGSSPYARGAQEYWQLFTDFLGIIPVCTGSTAR